MAEQSPAPDRTVPEAPDAAGTRRFVIVGSGLAGHNAAIQLRKLLPDAAITLLGEEDGLPYDRPPLTKAFLLGQVDAAALCLKHASDYAGLRIAHHARTAARTIDRDASTVATDDGEEFPYDALLLATGSRPRRLPCGHHDGIVRYMRTLADASLLRADLVAGRDVVVIGGGFIGLEVAAAAVTLGCRVTLIEASERLLSRGMPAELGHFALHLHQARGVQVILGQGVTEIEPAPAGKRKVSVAGGTIEADVVVVGIGVIPNTELAEEAGLAVDDGIVVDRHCRTSDPAIFAAGEVTAHPFGGDGPTGRLESWQVAAKQSVVAASCMAGGAQVFDEPPWLWSDQFDVNLQCIGRPAEAAHFLFRGDPAAQKWTMMGLDDDGLPVGAIAVNNGRDISMMRRALRAHEPLSAAHSAGFGPVPDAIWQK